MTLALGLHAFDSMMHACVFFVCNVHVSCIALTKFSDNSFCIKADFGFDSLKSEGHEQEHIPGRG